MKQVIICLVMIVSLCTAAHATTTNAYVATVLGSNAYTIENGGTQLYFHPQPDTTGLWYKDGAVLTYDYSYKVGATTYSGTSNRDGMKTFALSDVGYGQRLDSLKMEFDYFTGADPTTGINIVYYPTINIFITNGQGQYAIWSATSGGTPFTTQAIVGEPGWSHLTMDLTNRTNTTWGQMNEYNPGEVTAGKTTWETIRDWTIAGFYDFMQYPQGGFGAWDSTVWGNITNLGVEDDTMNTFGISLSWGDTVGGMYEDGNGELGLSANRDYGKAGRMIKDYQITVGSDTYDVTFVPEPTTICLLGLGAFGLLRGKK
jgi:hypothetical protein